MGRRGCGAVSVGAKATTWAAPVKLLCVRWCIRRFGCLGSVRVALPAGMGVTVALALCVGVTVALALWLL